VNSICKVIRSHHADCAKYDQLGGRRLVHSVRCKQNLVDAKSHSHRNKIYKISLSLSLLFSSLVFCCFFSDTLYKCVNLQMLCIQYYCNFSVFSERDSRSRSLYVVVRPSVVCRLSVVCNVGAPYSGDWNFRQCFYATWYLGYLYLWPFDINFTEIVPGEPLRWGVKPTRGRKM